MIFLFILNVALFIIITYASYLNTKGTLDTRKGLLPVAVISVVYYLLIGILGISGFTSFEALNGIAFFFGAIFVLGASFIEKRYGTRLSRLAFKTFAVYLVLELVIFNFNAYQLLSVHSPVAEELDISNKPTQSSNGTETEIEFTDFNKEVGTVNIIAHSQSKKKMVFDIDYSDATSKSYRTGVARAEIIEGCKKSYTIPINASGELGKIKFRFRADANDTITVESISINTPIAFKFSLVRLIVIFLIVLLKYALCDSKSLSQPLEENEKLCTNCVGTLTLIFILIALMLILAQRSGGLKNIRRDFLATSGNQITQDIVDAFEHGQTNMLSDVDPRIMALENPYDRVERESIPYPWDHLYYNGKYYSYYGIAPVLVLLLPYHFLTKHYFPCQWAIFIFMAVGIYFFYKLYMEYMKEFFGKTKISLVIMGYVLTQFVSGLWFMFPTPNFYELAQSSGYMFCTGGFYFLALSGVIGKRKIDLRYMAVSSALLSLGVLSRPTLALYCICALLFIFAGALKIRKTGEKKMLHFLGAALLPFGLFGAIQMWYNFVRFGSPFEFGIKYSLTVNDFVNAQMHPHQVGIGFYNFLIAFPSFRATFPFFYGDVQTFNPNGYYFVAVYSAIGLLWMAPILFSYIYGKKAYLLSQNEHKKLYSVMLIAVCVLSPFIMIASIWESGYGIRYKLDFAWQLLLGALTIAFIIYNNCNNEGVKKLLTKIFYISLIISFIFNFALIYSYATAQGAFNHAALDKWLCLFERAFEYWK